jgi:SAM-dependent methyltransferase
VIERRPERDLYAPAWAAREAAQADAYDRIGARYDAAFPRKEGQIRSGAMLCGRLPRHARVLDIGCGTGLPTARQLADAGLEVTGLDPSFVMCGLTHGNVPEAGIIQGELFDLYRLTQYYDAVVAFFSLLHLPRARIPDALRVVRRILRPGGWLVLGMVEADVDDQPITFLGERVRVTGYVRDELYGLIVAQGFGVEEQHVSSYAPATTLARPEIQLFYTCRQPS